MEDISDPYYWAQDPLARFEEDYPELVNKPVQEQKKSKLKQRSIKKKNKQTASFVVTKGLRRGRRLIKIQVVDLTNEDVKEGSDNEDNILLSAQYVVTDPIDEIMDQTENLINKISKSLLENHL